MEVMVRRAPRLRPRLSGRVVALAVIILVAACSSSSDDEAARFRPLPTRAVEPSRLPGALAGLDAIDRPLDDESRRRLTGVAEDAEDKEPRARNPLRIKSPDHDFVEDAQRAWTLALSSRLTYDAAHQDAARAMVDDWVTTTRRLRDTCPDSGACETSLVVSRAAPAFVFAVDILRAEGAYTAEETERFHDWLREVIVPAASDRDGNWGDAGTYLRAVAAVELGDEDAMVAAAERWREQIDLVGPDGQIPEEVRRGFAGLMYSQEALDYKVATADVLSRAGIDLWEVVGERGGSLRAALDLVVDTMADPDSWPEPVDDLRVPTPAGLWPIVASRWPAPAFDDLAREAAVHDGSGHSAITWTAITHPSTT